MAERFTGRRHTQIPFLNSLQVQDATSKSDHWWATNSAPQLIASARKAAPGPPTHSQPHKRKADEVHCSPSAKRRTTSGTQTHPTSVEGVEAQSAVTPLRSETLRDEFVSSPSQEIFPSCLGALRSRLSGVSIFSVSAPPKEPIIPSVEEEIPAVISPQGDLEEEEETVAQEGYGSNEWDI